MTEDEAKRLMEHYGITAAQQPVYHYNGFRYGNLTDALSYAELLTSRGSKSGTPQGVGGSTSPPLDRFQPL
jgi:hypothetical protein